MSADTKKNVVQMPVRATARATKVSEKKWGRDVMEAKNFCIVPSLLLHAQARLGMSATHLALVMHLIDFWWQPGRYPWPSKATLAARVRLSPRQVQRQMADLEAMGLIRRVERRGSNRGKLSNEYDLSGLVARLKQLAPEFKAVDEEAKKKRQAVARPGIRNRATATTDDE